MNQQIGLTEFFAMEAGGYLERLDALVSGSRPPAADELVRLARQLRGSALMAKQAPIAQAAAAFESFARQVRAGERPWDEANRQLAIRAVDDFKILVRAAAQWTPAEDAKAEALVGALDPHGGVAQPSAAMAGGGIDVGTRAFIGREGSAVASALDRAAKSLQQHPAVHDPLHRVLQVAQPLRGLAVLAEVPPMPDLLDGIERAIGDVVRRGGTQPSDALLFNAAARALAHAAQEVAAHGAATPDSEPMQEFARRLGDLLGLDESAVPVSDLFYDDAGPHVVREGTVSVRPGGLGRLELVSHGEHLRLAADQIERATSSIQRELRAQTLAGTFRALSVASGGALDSAVARFASAARDAVARGVPSYQTAQFVARLREASGLLGGAPEGDDPALAAAVAQLADQLAQLPGGVSTPAPPPRGTLRRPPAPSVSTAVPTEAATPVPRAGAPSATPARPAARATRVKAGASEGGDLVGSWIRYERYREQLPDQEPSLEELLSGPPADPRRTAAPAAPAVVPQAPEPPAVPITDLLYRGPAALERALALREQVRAAVAAGASGAEVAPLLEEVFDLVALGLHDA